MSMKIARTMLLIIALTAIFAASQVSAQYVYNNNNRNDGKGTVNVFVATDTKSDDSGYGASLTLKSDPTATVTYIHFDNFDLIQVSKYQPTHLGGYPLKVGLSLAYANSRVNEDFNPYEPVMERPDGLLSGLEASVSLGKPQSNFSIDLRASSLSKNVNPLKWIGDADLLWIGAGISFKY
ncbi:MAG: hypothetical protein ACYC0V_05715 [Armatimonadota bacterium]